MLPPVIAVVGATASGKSALSLDLAERLDGEIVNTDSMQVYRGMDVGTAKLPAAERRGIPHHLLDFLDVTETASVAEFQRLARASIEDIRRRGKTPVLVGGSALYTRAIVDVFDFPGTDPELRARLEAELEEHGSGELHRRLAEKDAAAASAILPSNGRRIVRALEVIELTGSFNAELPEPTYALDNVIQVGVDIDRPTVDERIARRVDQMWAEGFVDEVLGLRPAIDQGLTASRAIGYRQILMMLDRVITEAQAREQTVTGTRRFSRRQDSWFRNDERVRWVAADDATRAALEALT